MAKAKAEPDFFKDFLKDSKKAITPYTPYIAGAGLLLQGIGTYSQESATKKGLELQADYARRQSHLLSFQAHDIFENRLSMVPTMISDSQAFIENQKSTAAASGIRSDTGSALLMQEETISTAKLNVENYLRNIKAEVNDNSQKSLQALRQAQSLQAKADDINPLTDSITKTLLTGATMLI